MRHDSDLHFGNNIVSNIVGLYYDSVNLHGEGTMTDQTEGEKRPRGRPARPESNVRTILLKTTLSLLLEGGYSAVTVDSVARRAHVAKKTLYRFAANRDELMVLAVGGWADEFQSAFVEDAEKADAVPVLLINGLNAIARQVLSPEAVGMFRLLQNDFPGRETLIDVYQCNGIQRGRSILAAWLHRQYVRGFLREFDWMQTSDLLLAMTIAEPLRQISLGLFPAGGNINERVAAAIFLVSPGLMLDLPPNIQK